MKLVNIEKFFCKVQCNKPNNGGECKPLSKLSTNKETANAVKNGTDLKDYRMNFQLKYEKHFHQKYQKLELHEFCITFKNKWTKVNVLTLHNNVTKYITKLCQRWEKKLNYQHTMIILYPEFSSSSRFHYHGIAYFDNANEYYIHEFKRLLNNRYGRTTGKRIYNFNNYWKYITKDNEKNKGLIMPYAYVNKITKK